jgi:FKBP-type peptidyl-prolyl cis-trans isomerase (trigger factor)
MYRGMTIDQYIESQGFKDHDDWVAKELRPTAEKRVKNGLILAELARVEKIAVTDDEINARQAQIVAQYNDPTMKGQFESEAARRDIANRLVTEKTLDELVALNS